MIIKWLFILQIIVYHEQIKHIEVNSNFIGEKNMETIISFVKSQDQLADISTKPLVRAQPQHIFSKLGFYDIYISKMKGEC